MTSLLLSAASRKALVSGLVAALLTPVITLLSSGGEVTLRTLVLAVLSGIVSTGAVFATTNTPPGPVTVEDLPGEHAADR